MLLNSYSRDHAAKAYDPETLQRLSDHENYFRLDLTSVSVPPDIAWKFEGDFFGLLDYLNISFRYHYILTILNGLENSQDYDGVNVVVTVVENFSVIDRVMNS